MIISIKADLSRKYGSRLTLYIEKHSEIVILTYSYSFERSLNIREW
jgi:hypothetical protein